MADLNIALILRLVDRATAPARAVARVLGGLNERLGAAAARASAGTRLMRDGMTELAGVARSGATVLAAYGASAAALTAAFIRPAAQFERFQTQLTALEGSSEGARSAMLWIEEFATRTPIELDETVSAYARLRAFGLDPTNGSLLALVDTMAATGGGGEQLGGLVLALGQAWSKGKLQGEEALQMLERGVPVWDLMAQKLGVTTEEVQKLSSKGKLGRAEIMLLVEALGEMNSGASQKASATWDGILSNLLLWMPLGLQGFSERLDM